MSKFVFDNSPGIKILTEEQVKKIHEEAHKYALEKNPMTMMAVI